MRAVSMMTFSGALSKNLVRSKMLSLEGSQSNVWLDVRKSFEERRPTRQTKLLRDLILEHMKKEPLVDADAMRADVRTRSVSIRGIKVAWLDRQGDANFAC